MKMNRMPAPRMAFSAVVEPNSRRPIRMHSKKPTRIALTGIKDLDDTRPMAPEKGIPPSREKDHKTREKVVMRVEEAKRKQMMKMRTPTIVKARESKESSMS